MIKRIHTLLLAAIMFAASSCITDEIDTGGLDIPPQGGNEVLLRLKTPGGFNAPQTRGLDYAKENTIDDIYVLAFDTGDDLVYIKEADDVKDKTTGDEPMTEPDGNISGGGTFSVALPQMEDGNQYKLVVLANAEAILASRGFIDAATHEFKTDKTGNSYADVTAAIYGSFSGPLYTTNTGTIPMWGETAQPIKITPAAAIPTISMRRALARIDVGVGEYNETDNTWNGKKGTADILFALTSVNVVRPNDRYAVIPDPAKASDVPSNTGSKYTVAGSSGFTYPVSNNRSITYGIYVPEADVKMGETKSGDPTNHTNRMAIVVGGSYNGGGTTYYRLDFADGSEDLVDVLRNHLYRFTITGVDGQGYSSVADAYAARPMNMTVRTEVVKESNDLGNIVFDDQYYLAYDPGKFTFESDGGEQTLNIDTDYPTWTAKVGNEAGNALSPNWLRINQTSGTAGLGTVTLTADPNVVVTPRTAFIHITAGRITLKIEVTQDGVVLWGGHDDILYFGADNRLSIGKWDDGNITLSNMVFTQFGSVIGFTNVVGWNNTTSIRFNPTPTASYGYTSIPNYNAWTGDATTSPSVSDPAYHTGANIKAGRGDICKLVGLTSAEAQAMSEAELEDWNANGEGWRLPTARENVSFVGGAPDYAVWQNWKVGDASYFYSNAAPNATNTRWQYYYSSTGARTTTGGNAAAPATGRFPVVTDSYNDEYSQKLPAAGHRGYDNGFANSQGSLGYYWSSTVSRNASGHYLDFSSSSGVYPVFGSRYSSGHSVRCVRP